MFFRYHHGIRVVCHIADCSRMLAMFMAAILLSRSEGEWVVIKHLEPHHYNFQMMTTEPPTANQTMTTQTYKALQDLLLNVHRSLIKESSQPFYRRFNFLNGLKLDLLHQMWAECHNVWTNRADIQGRTHKKHFPSLEGALLTISFLTFAVFLIKVVKQFIQGLQGMNGNNTVMQMQLQQPAKVVKHKRETEYMNLADKILKYIHDFQIQYKTD